MKSKDADWATRHHFDVIMSGALQAKSLGWLSLKIVPLDSQCISNASSAPRCRPRLLFLYLYSVNGASSFVCHGEDGTFGVLPSQRHPSTNLGGYSHVKAYRDVLPKWVTFSPKILKHGSYFGQKKSLEEGPISQKLQKNCKISYFWGRKSLKNGSPFAFKKKNCKISHFLSEKTL